MGNADAESSSTRSGWLVEAGQVVGMGVDSDQQLWL